MTIRRKLFLLGLAALCAVTAVGAVIAARTRDAVRSEVRRNLVTVADLEAQLIGQHLDLDRQRIRQFASSADGDRIAQALDGADRLPDGLARDVLARAVGGGDDDVAAVAIVRPDGFVVADSSLVGAPLVGLTGGELADLLAALPASRDGAVGGAVADGEAGRYLQLVPDRTDGPRFLLLVQFDLRPVTGIVGTRTALDPTAEVAVVQRAGSAARTVVEARRQPAARRAEVPLTATADPAVQAALGRTGVIEADGGRGAVLAAVRPIPDTPWAIVTQVDRSAAFGSADRLLTVQVVGFLLGGLALALGTWLLTRSLLRRIERLTASAEAMSHGMLDTRVGDQGGDELGQLARAFDRMADTLEDDLERRKRVETRLDHQARHDPLTDLPNRAHLETRLRELAAAAARNPGGDGPRHAALLFCDLDEFKAVNDELGHAVGDELLRTVASRFRSAIRPTDLLARFGGDEFVVLCAELHHAEEAEHVARRLQAVLADPVVLGGREIFASVSVGIAPFVPGNDATQVLREADAAMYRAKELGKRRHVTHDPAIGAAASSRLREGTELRRAVERNELEVLYQPIRSLDDGSVVALEALVRWPRAGALQLPAAFLPRLDALGLTSLVDRWVLHTAIGQLARWRRAGMPGDVRLAVNASSATLDVEDVVGETLAALQTAGLTPGHLVLDVREEAATSTDPLRRATLGAFAAAGVGVAVDDFGRGSLGVSTLHRVPAEQVKLDRSVVTEVDRDRRARAAARTLISLAGDLGLAVVAEGIERPAQADALRSVGCALGQGFALGLPAWADDLTPELCRA